MLFPAELPIAVLLSPAVKSVRVLPPKAVLRNAPAKPDADAMLYPTKQF